MKEQAMLDEAQLTLLQEVADKITTGRELMGSQWSNCEAEVIALQTLSANALNFKEHGDAFSWQGTGTKAYGQCGTDNPRGMQLLLDDGMIVVEPREGDAPDSTVTNEQDMPMVIRVTPKLVYYAASKILTKVSQ